MGEGQQDDGGFPVKSIGEALRELRRPFAPEAVRFKIQAEEKGANRRWAQVVAYVDARLVSERLNKVAGGSWAAEITPLAAELEGGEDRDQDVVRAVCHLSVFGVRRMDVGEGRDPKAAFSDALKRAAVLFGVGRSLYAMKAVYLYTDKGETRVGKRPNGRVYLTGENERWLREGYARWLRRKKDAFGAVLDHGDESGAGEEEAAAGASTVPSAGDDAQTGEQAQGRLRPVGHGGPAPKPAARAERAKLEAAIEASGYSAQTVRRLAGVVCGESAPERLSGDQVAELQELIGSAHKGGVSEARLGEAAQRAARYKDRKRARTRLRKWVMEESGRHQRAAA